MEILRNSLNGTAFKGLGSYWGRGGCAVPKNSVAKHAWAQALVRRLVQT